MAEEEISTWVIATLTSLMAILGIFLWARSIDLGMGLFGFGLLVFGLAFDFWLLKRHYDGIELRAHEKNLP